MPFWIVALSGPVSAGKTELAMGLAAKFEGVMVLKTREIISQALGGVELERKELQEAGRRLDHRDNGRWVAQAVGRLVVASEPNASHLVIDSCRIEGQVDGLREAFGAHVVHVHLTAPRDVLSVRYKKKRSAIKELSSYDEVVADSTEAQVESLAQKADIVIDTDRCGADDVVVRAAAQLGLYGRDYERLVDVLVGGQWGSEGKGHIASYLAPEYDVLVRVGGPNAGHKVYRRDGVITYHHLPSGTQENENARIVIGPGAVVNPEDLAEEIALCRLATDRLFIDPQAMVIEPADIRRENKSMSSIGSTKRGVGAATARKILRPAAHPRVRLVGEIPALKDYLRPAREVLDEAFRAGQRVFLEGTQGSGLSIHHGQYPFVTSRDTTVSGCLAEAGIAPSRVRRIIMVVRRYPIRVHGTSGPMGKEISWAEVARRSGHNAARLRKHEHTSTTNKLRRVSEFSWTLLRQAASLNGPTDIALSFADYDHESNAQARRFEELHPETIQFIEDIERVATAPVSMIVTRFRHPERSIIDRRKWGNR